MEPLVEDLWLCAFWVKMCDLYRTLIFGIPVTERYLIACLTGSLEDWRHRSYLLVKWAVANDESRLMGKIVVPVGPSEIVGVDVQRDFVRDLDQLEGAECAFHQCSNEVGEMLVVVLR